MVERKRATYVPERGDIVWINFSPNRGHEQGGRRPAVVLSKSAYNKRTGLAVYCPITSKTKGYPFEIEIRTKNINGAALADHIKNLDSHSRNVKFRGRLDIETVEKIASIAAGLLLP